MRVLIQRHEVSSFTAIGMIFLRTSGALTIMWLYAHCTGPKHTQARLLGAQIGSLYSWEGWLVWGKGQLVDPLLPQVPL